MRKKKKAIGRGVCGGVKVRKEGAFVLSNIS